MQIEDGVYHVSEEGSAIDSYPAGFAVVDGVLCHVSVTGSFFDSYPAGFATIDGKLYHVSRDGYAIDQYAEGLQEIDGGMYYAMADGSFLYERCGRASHLWRRWPLYLWQRSSGQLCGSSVDRVH